MNAAQASMTDWQSLYKVIVREMVCRAIWPIDLPLLQFTLLRYSIIPLLHYFLLRQCAYNGIYIGDICNSQPKTIYIFKKVTAHAYTHAHSLIPCVSTDTSQIAGEFSDDLHRIASLITKVVSLKIPYAQGRLKYVCMCVCVYVRMWVCVYQVDFEESSLQQRFCVKPHVDEELDKREHLFYKYTHCRSTYNVLYYNVLHAKA